MDHKTQGNIGGFEVVAIISCVGAICWIISDWYGGMILFLIAYSAIVLPIVCMYLISLIDTIVSTVKEGKGASKIKIVAHSAVLIVSAVALLLNSELLKSSIRMSAVLVDDLSSMRLIFRDNGVVENRISGMFGSEETIYGEYKIVGDKIIFSKNPYINDFLPDEMLIDTVQNAIFIARDESGEFAVDKAWLNHFKIE